MNKRKIGEWIYRIFCFMIIDSFIIIVGFTGLHYSMLVLIDANKLNLGTQIGLTQASLAIMFLSIANILYWILDINLFNFKKIWRKDNEGAV